MDLRQIRYFVAVYEEGSLSKAAQREHCTQPGLSVHIQQLETMVGQRLFDRTARGVTPTVAGRHFYASCTKVLRAVREARQQMLDLAGNVAGSINIGVPPSFCKGPLPGVLQEYLVGHPYVDVRLAEAYSGTLSQWVAAGELEIAIVTEPPADLGLETTRFYRDRLVLVRGTANGSTCTPPSGAWTPEDLRSLKLVLPSRRHSLRKAIESGVHSASGGCGKIVEIDGLVGTLELVRNSEWATILPTVAVVNEVRQQQLTAEPIVDPELWLEYFLVQAKDRPLSVPARNFLELLKDVLDRSGRDWADLREAHGATQPPARTRTPRRQRPAKGAELVEAAASSGIHVPACEARPALRGER